MKGPQYFELFMIVYINFYHLDARLCQTVTVFTQGLSEVFLLVLSKSDLLLITFICESDIDFKIVFHKSLC